jgi:hypothetical protein
MDSIDIPGELMTYLAQGITWDYQISVSALRAARPKGAI